VSRKKPIEFLQQGTFELLDAAQAFASEDIVERPDSDAEQIASFQVVGWK
jgi:hypothetical protein